MKWCDENPEASGRKMPDIKKSNFERLYFSHKRAKRAIYRDRSFDMNLLRKDLEAYSMKLL